MTSIPESPGKRLREAREALGKTTSELAVKTRIKVQQLEGLEADEYDSIPAPMYVRGFLKLYAQELGLDPAPILEAYKQSGQDSTPERRITRQPPDPLQTEPIPEPRAEKPLRKSQKPIFSTATPIEDQREPNDGRAQAGKDFINRLLNLLLDAEWWTGSWIPRIVGGIAGILLISMILIRNLSGPGTAEDPVADSPEADGSGASPLPELSDPLVQDPAPLYFELPRTLE